MNWYQSVYPAMSKFEKNDKAQEYQEWLKNGDNGNIIEIKSERSWLWTIWGMQFLVFIIIPFCLSELLWILYNHYYSRRKYKAYTALET